MDTEIHGYRDTGYRDTWIQRYMDTEIHEYRDTWIQRYMDTDIDGCRYQGKGIKKIKEL